MKKVFTSFALMLALATANAQTTAPNWTATDCNSVSHTLYNELDSGKIIVFIWVMPCASCVPGAKAAYNAVQSFATSHPGKVRFYMADDLGDASCSILSNWVTTNTIGSLSNMTIFSNAGNVISEAGFGGTGMPHVVVLSGGDHEILYNKKNSLTNDQPGITAAINTGIATLAARDLKKNATLSVSPNPSHDVFAVSYASAVEQVIVTSVTGQVVRNMNFEKGAVNPVISLGDAAPGIYFIKVVDVNGKVMVKEITKQ
ncbi:MAG: hypothetical protein K0Q79_2189 [Flavipsychrobacter sp.]|jgi:hypothetical protein|nr:hypothetical protein [Flavipsychrobacter sp.]